MSEFAALEDAVRGAVVLLERDDLGAGEVVLELDDVPDVGPAEGVDRLVGIADREDVPVLAGEELEKAVLGVVRVLVLVHEDVAERLLPAFRRLGKAVEDLDRQHDQVVEVERVRGEEPPLVELVRLRDRLVVERGDAGAILLRADELVLRGRDLRVDAARGEALRVALELLQGGLHDADLVGLVVDREVRAEPETRRFPAEDPAAGRVERHHPHRPGDAADEPLEPPLHLPRGLVREGDREDLVGADTVRLDQVDDAVGEDARLARARAGDDEHRPLGREDGLLLGGIQVGEVLLGRRDGHAPMLDAPAPGPGGRFGHGRPSRPSGCPAPPLPGGTSPSAGLPRAACCRPPVVCRIIAGRSQNLWKWES